MPSHHPINHLGPTRVGAGLPPWLTPQHNTDGCRILPIINHHRPRALMGKLQSCTGQVRGTGRSLLYFAPWDSTPHPDRARIFMGLDPWKKYPPPQYQGQSAALCCTPRTEAPCYQQLITPAHVKLRGHVPPPLPLQGRGWRYVSASTKGYCRLRLVASISQAKSIFGHPRFQAQQQVPRPAVINPAIFRRKPEGVVLGR